MKSTVKKSHMLIPISTIMIKIKGVRLHIGTFKTLIDAENAYLKAKYEGIVRLCERYDTDLSLETKNAILKHAKRKTLDKVSASAL